MRRVFNWLGSLLMGVCFSLLILLFLLPALFHWRFDAILSGSMNPALRVGGVVAIQPVDPYSIRKGDIIAFKFPDRVAIAHRVIEVLDSEDGLSFRTKGDANEEEDPYLVYPRDVLGRVTFHVPFVGYLTAFFQTRLGSILFVILPGLIAISAEMKTLLAREPRRLAARGRRRKGHGIEYLCGLFAGVAIIAVGGFMAQIGDVKTIDYKSSGEATSSQAISQRLIQNGSPFPFLVYLKSDSPHITFSESQFMLGPRERKTVDILLTEERTGSWNVSYRSAWFLPLAPAEVVSALLAWNPTAAPFIVASVPIVPSAIFVFLLLRMRSSRRKRRRGRVAWRKAYA